MSPTLEITPDTLDRITKIEALCGRDIGHGIGPLVQAAQGGLLGATRSIATHPSPHVVLVTGFFVPRSNPPAAETDGPIGCAHLAAGLQRAGIPVRLLTDPLCFNAIKVAAEAAGVTEDIAYDVLPVEITRADDPAVTQILDRWQQANPPVSHVISVERVGPGIDGICRNINGDDISAHTAPLQFLFDRPELTSIGVGDLGNELGMGSLSKELIAQTIKRGETIACITPCDHLIFCGVSNWGAVGILLTLALLRPDWQSQLLDGFSVESDRYILEKIVYDGPAVDGDTAVQAMTIETFPWEYHGEALTEMLTLAGFATSS